VTFALFLETNVSDYVLQADGLQKIRCLENMSIVEISETLA